LPSPPPVTNVTLVPAEQKANPNFDFEEDSLRRRRKGKAPLIAAGILGGLVAIAAVSGAIAWTLRGDGDKDKGGDGSRTVAQGPTDDGSNKPPETGRSSSNKGGSTEPGSGTDGQKDPPNGVPPIRIAVEHQPQIVKASDPQAGGPPRPVSTDANF